MIFVCKKIIFPLHGNECSDTIIWNVPGTSVSMIYSCSNIIYHWNIKRIKSIGKTVLFKIIRVYLKTRKTITLKQVDDRGLWRMTSGLSDMALFANIITYNSSVQSPFYYKYQHCLKHTGIHIIEIQRENHHKWTNILFILSNFFNILTLE